MKAVSAEVLSIGDEILYGQITDTNSQWISAELDKVGIKTIRKTTVGDEEGQILGAFKEAESRAEIVLITGGLGPTPDDLTKPLLARYFDSSLSMHPEALKNLEEMFAKRGFELNDLNRQQAVLPDKCEMITNRMGTAPGMWFHQKGKVFVSMPGVPFEMKTMMSEIIIPKLLEIYQPPVIYHKMIKTVGIGESWLSEKIKAWQDNLPTHIKLAYLPHLSQVRLRLTAMGSDMGKLKTEVEKQIQSLLPLAGKYIYGYDDDKLEEVVGNLLRQQGKTVATAESCTGGFLAHSITSIAGSSDYFMGGIIPYQNEMKENLLGVQRETLIEHGAVSEETVFEMANRAREKFKTDFGLATSGVAGPGGGTPDKPVGTVWIALADGKQTFTKKLSLAKDRLINIQLTVVAILDILRQSLNQNN
ncbi:competence/damage-inducible protein A [Xanthovirga aplysinae]|uniref:competence/damage-inducible protein A n=1 Tax=Xanthovirga aplysinae TaxID=2529853 RepID=UPI0012BBAE47|nr:competence/damage-inducible protein A [Xanthovirga aplysinae]MTI31060.1 competence/damage-inducible protein A [Xanthovirga aplysinae]